MNKFRVAAACFLAFTTSALCAQGLVAKSKPAAPVAPVSLIVDVHPSPYSPTTYSDTNISDGRFDMRNATLMDMIALAWDRRPETVVGGPPWIDFYRYDVSAKIDSLRAPRSIPAAKSLPNPAAAGEADGQPDPYVLVRPVLQQVLARRFHLTFAEKSVPLPGFAVTQAKGGAKLTEAKDGAAGMDCHSEQVKDTPGVYATTCTSMTMARFIAIFGNAYPHMVVDQTGLTKAYDFRMTQSMTNVRTQEEYVRALTDMLARQLGLIVTEKEIAQPAMAIETLDQTPTPNDPELVKLIPPLPALEFEVASIKPAAPDDPQWTTEPRGSQISFRGWTLQDLIVHAWRLPTGRMIENVASLPRQRYSIVVKLPPDIDARAAWQDEDEVFRMLQKLVEDRFEVKYHWGEQTQDGWVLLADNSKMKKADPKSRTFCRDGPAEGEKDVRGADSPFDNVFHCQNVTMGQFADVLQSFTRTEIKSHVLDKTGLAGSYDFTVYFSSTARLQGAPVQAAAGVPESAGDSTPSAGMSLRDALRKELGVRLEKQPMAQPVMVLDHFDQNPTEN